MGDTEGKDVASQLWTKMQKRIDHVEGKQVEIKSKTLAGQVFKKHVFGDIDADTPYDEAQDFKLGSKRKMDVDDDEDDAEETKPKKKKRKVKEEENDDDDEDMDAKKEKKKKKKDKKKKKKKKMKEEEA